MCNPPERAIRYHLGISDRETPVLPGVDVYGAGSVLSAISEILREKSDHLATNWQDTAMARHYSKGANAVLRLAEQTGIGIL